jgi:hypothetical protein
VHFTRPQQREGRSLSAVSVLLEILASRKLKGSDTSSGFIVGDRRAVCFQDVPLAAGAQNIYFEQQFREQTKSNKIRQVGVGLMFEKPYIFKRGGRPVIYEERYVAKQMLPPEEYWRIVHFDLSNDDSYCDWTHEREWRIPGDFSFDLNKATIVLASHKDYKVFIHKCLSNHQQILKEILGIVNLSAVFY